MNVPLIDLKAQYATIRDDVDAAMRGVVDRCDFILGGDVAAFETEFSEYCGAPHCVGVATGTDAITLALRALGVGPGDEVIVPAMTFIATALGASQAGATPVLVDIDPVSYNIDTDHLAAAITERTRVIMPVHLYGQIANMREVCRIAEAHDLPVIEDAAQAHGAMRDGKRAGSFGVAAGFSFYPGKNLGGYGDGGGLVTQSDAIAEQICMMRDYGQREKYVHLTKGGNSRLDTIQAAVLRVKLRHLDAWNRARGQHAVQYDAALATIEEVERPIFDASVDLGHVFHQYVIQVERRDDLLQHLKDNGVFAGIHYPIPIHLLPAYSDLGHGEGAFPVAEKLGRSAISLPMFAEMTDAQRDHVIDTLRSFYA